MSKLTLRKNLWELTNSRRLVCLRRFIKFLGWRLKQIWNCPQHVTLAGRPKLPGSMIKSAKRLNLTSTLLRPKLPHLYAKAVTQNPLRRQLTLRQIVPRQMRIWHSRWTKEA